MQISTPDVDTVMQEVLSEDKLERSLSETVVLNQLDIQNIREFWLREVQKEN